MDSMNKLIWEDHSSSLEPLGYGLTNINARLRIRYEKQYRIEFEHNPGGGLITRLVIPNNQQIESNKFL